MPGEERPSVIDGDFELICQPLDFLGVNYYTRGIVRAAPSALYEVLPPGDVPLTGMGWEIYPQGLGEVLGMLYKKYQMPPVIITENGIALNDSSPAGDIEDHDRTRYIESHLESLNQAMLEGADVRGYFAWSLMDNFEWSYGLSKRFGLVHVDYSTQKRTVKSSGHAFREMLQRRKDESSA
jgi:beta-glucosidase